jgi:hypothetical protein
VELHDSGVLLIDTSCNCQCGAIVIEYCICGTLKKH